MVQDGPLTIHGLVYVGREVAVGADTICWSTKAATDNDIKVASAVLSTRGYFTVDEKWVKSEFALSQFKLGLCAGANKVYLKFPDFDT